MDCAVFLARGHSCIWVAKGVGNGFSPHNGSPISMAMAMAMAMPRCQSPFPQEARWSGGLASPCDRFMSKSVGQPGPLACSVGQAQKMGENQKKVYKKITGIYPRIIFMNIKCLLCFVSLGCIHIFYDRR